MLDETLSGESMTLKFINETNGKLKFFYRTKKISKPGTLKNALQCTYSTTFWFSISSISLLLFVLCLIPLIAILCKSESAYQFSSNKDKINDLFFMDD